MSTDTPEPGTPSLLEPRGEQFPIIDVGLRRSTSVIDPPWEFRHRASRIVTNDLGWQRLQRSKRLIRAAVRSSSRGAYNRKIKRAHRLNRLALGVHYSPNAVKIQIGFARLHHAAEAFHDATRFATRYMEAFAEASRAAMRMPYAEFVRHAGWPEPADPSVDDMRRRISGEGIVHER